MLYIALPSFTCTGINTACRSAKMSLSNILVRVYEIETADRYEWQPFSSFTNFGNNDENQP